MQISSLEIKFTAADILSIIRDYVDVEGLIIEDINVNEFLTIRGSYTKILKLKFQVTCEIVKVENNIIELKIRNVRIGKLSVMSFLKNFLLNKLINKLSEIGIVFRTESIFISLENILKLLPFYLDLQFNGIRLVENILIVKVNEMKLSFAKKAGTKPDIEAQVQQLKEHETGNQVPALVKVEDNYTKLRDITIEKTPDKYKKVLEYAMIMPDVIALLFRLFRDKRVNLKTKAVVGGVLLYLVSPFQMLPDFIPFIGEIDDIALAFYALNRIINEVPQNVIIENWQGKDDIIIKIREGVEYINKLVGGPNIAKLSKILGKLNSSRDKGL